MANTKSSGIGFTGLLTIVFIVLKLTKFIDWSWFWVLSPTIIPIILGLIYVFVAIYIKYHELKEEKEKFTKFTELNNDKSKWKARYDEVMESQKKLENMKNKFGK